MSAERPFFVNADPPLRAVRTFEVFARHENVSAAARELNVSASAVSHQLGLLEDFLDTPLTARHGRNLTLSEQGRIYYRSIRSAFTMLRSATDQLREQAATRQITISLIPLFCMELFIPRLGEFLDEHPEVDVNIMYANHRSYPSDASDISIRFGSGQWNGYRSEKLFSGAMAPFCSRAFLARHGPLESDGFFAEVPLLHDEERGSWMQWMDIAQVRRKNHSNGPLFEDGLLTLAASLAGQGCALLRPPLVDHHVRGGELVRLSDTVLDDGRDYYLCRRLGIEFSAESLSLYAWVKKICGDQLGAH
jgi:DNA-binding transcriptional LysR family regulator